LGDFNTTIVTGGHILVQRRITRAAARSYGYPNGIPARALQIAIGWLSIDGESLPPDTGERESA